MIAIFALAAAATLPVAASEPPRDALLEERRANLPKTLPWPTSFFQPQAAVDGSPSPLMRVQRNTISAANLLAAEAYARQQKSTAFLVWADGQLQHAWFAPGTGASTISHSYTMQYTPLVLLVGMAIAEGKIASLDAPASTWLTEWRGDARSKITIRHLLQQHAGLDMRFDAHYSKGLYSRDARAYWGANTKQVLLNEYPVTHPPGTRFDYNYIVPEVLSVILERATGMRYERLLSERLWKPLGNNRAYLWLNRPSGEVHVDAGLFSAPTDWLNVGRLILQNGRWNSRQLVPAAFVAEMKRPSPGFANFGFMYLGSPFAPERRMATDPRVTYLVKSSAPFVADDVAYVDGYGGQRAYVIPSRNMVIVRIGDVARTWDNSRLVNLVLGETR